MNLRLSILLVAVLVLFGGTFLVVRYFGPNERKQDEPWLYHVDEDRVVRIEVSNEGKNAVYSKDPGSNRWLIRGEPDIPVFIEKWGGTPLLLSGPRVNRTLAEAIDDPASFGLDPPESVVKVSIRSGQTFEFHIGKATPDEANQYIRLAGHTTLFTVPSIWAKVVNRLALKPPYLQLFQLEDGFLGLIEVSDSGKTTTYRKKNDQMWYVVESEESPVEPGKWGDTADFLSGPRVNKIVEEEIDNPEDYGLDPPQTKVRLGLVQGPNVEFYLGDVTPDGKHRYAYLEGKTTLFAMPTVWAKRITDLAVAPPYQTSEQAQPGSG
jgi:hypothetical protein